MTVATHPTSSLTQKVKKTGFVANLWLLRELFHLCFQMLTSPLTVSPFSNPISLSPQFPPLCLVIFYISQITVGDLKFIFDSCEEQVENRLNGEGEREKKLKFVPQVEVIVGYTGLELFKV